MNKFKYLTISLCLLGLQTALAQDRAEALSTGQTEIPKSGVFLDGVAAVVNEGVVTRSQLSRQIVTIEKRASESELQLPPADILQEQVLE